MEVLPMKERLPPSDLVTAMHVHAMKYACYCTARGVLFVDVPASKRLQEVALFSAPPPSTTTSLGSSNRLVDRVQIAAERWDCIIALAHGQLFAVSLKTLAREAIAFWRDEANSPVLCFAIDERSDRLVIATKRKLYVKRWSAAHKFDEVLFAIDLQDGCQDLCLVVENGQRWICVSCWESTVWKNAEQQQQQQLMGREDDDATLTLAACDFLQQGRSESEVVLCKSNTCWFASPSNAQRGDNHAAAAAGLIRFADAVWQLVLVQAQASLHYIVAGLKNSMVQVALDSGEILQTLEGFPSSLYRFSFNKSSDGMQVAHAAAKKTLQPVLPVSNKVLQLLSPGQQQQTGLALALCSKLVEQDVLPLLQRCKVEHACALLQARPSCSMEDMKQIVQLDITQFAPKRRLLRLFGDTDLFDSVQHCSQWLDSVFPTNKQEEGGGINKTVFARFQPGVFNLALQQLFLPLLLDLRREQAAETRARIDSLLLRAFCLATRLSPSLVSIKEDFFANNECSVEESEALLLRFPEMWEDHAALLKGKGLFAKGVEWLAVLGRNAPTADSAERYAAAAVRMLGQRPELLLVTGNLDWILNRVPSLGINALVEFNSFATVEAAKEYFTSKQVAGLIQLYLERLVQVRAKECAPEAWDELALIYLQPARDAREEEDHRTAFHELISSAGEMNFAALAGNKLLDGWPEEQALVLDRLGRRNDAAFALATRCPLPIAERYASQQLGVENVFGTVFDGLVSVSRFDDAMEFLTRNFDKLDAGKCLGRLPKDMVLDKGKLGWFRTALLGRIQVHRDQQIEKQLLRAEHFDAMERLAQAQAKYVIIGASDRCSACNKVFKPDNPLLVFQSRVWHYACYEKM